MADAVESSVWPTATPGWVAGAGGPLVPTRAKTAPTTEIPTARPTTTRAGPRRGRPPAKTAARPFGTGGLSSNDGSAEDIRLSFGLCGPRRPAVRPGHDGSLCHGSGDPAGPLSPRRADRGSRREELPAGAISVEPLLDTLRSLHPDADTTVVRRAHDLARRAHEGQLRLSGEPYLTHTIAVATIVAELGLDETSVAAALLHDVVEDTPVSIGEIESSFGTVIAQIVDGVTKLDRLNFSTKEAQQAATIRKMVIAMSKDWRVLVIKLADRLHNMRTIDVMPEWKQRRTAQQTLDVYAPLAHRLGIQQIKWQLEDLSFRALQPKVYDEIAQMVATRAPEPRTGGRGSRRADEAASFGTRHSSDGHRTTETPVEYLRKDGRAEQGV